MKYDSITREWTADSSSGTTQKDQAIWVESADSVGFSIGFSCTAMIQEGDTSKFLYQYTSKDLASVMDTEIRAKIQESAVIGLSGGLKGEIPKAFIVLKEKETLTEQEVKAFCKKNLASYKIPRFVEFRSSLPKTPTGKILKKNLRQEEGQKTHD